MSHSSDFKLIGAAKSASTVDCVGIPVFEDIDGRMVFCETDEKLHIVGFHEILEKDWIIGYGSANSGSTFSIGSTAPIAFWQGGKLQIVSSGHDLHSARSALSGAKARPAVTSRVLRAIDAGLRAREESNPERWNDFYARYGQFLDKKPQSTRTWVKQFNEMLNAVNEVDNVPQRVVEDIKRTVVYWAAKCAATSSWKVVFQFAEGLLNTKIPELRYSPASAVALLAILTKVRQPSESVVLQLHHLQSRFGEMSLLRSVDPYWYRREGEFSQTIERFLSAFRRAVSRGDGWRAWTCSRAMLADAEQDPHTREVLTQTLSIQEQLIARNIPVFESIINDSAVGHEVKTGTAFRLVNDLRLMAAILRALHGVENDLDVVRDYAGLSASALDRLRGLAGDPFKRNRLLAS